MEREWRESGARTDTPHVSKPPAKVRYKFVNCKYFCKNLRFPTFSDLFRPSFRLSVLGFTPAVSPRRRDGRSAQRGAREGASRANREHAAKRSAGEHTRESEEATERGTQQARGPGTGRHGGGGQGQPTPSPQHKRPCGALCGVFTGSSGRKPTAVLLYGRGDRRERSAAKRSAGAGVYKRTHRRALCIYKWQLRAYTNGKGGREQGEREHPAPQTARHPSSAREAAERHPQRAPKRRGREAAQEASGAKRGGAESAAERPRRQKARPNEAEERERGAGGVSHERASAGGRVRQGAGKPEHPATATLCHVIDDRGLEWARLAPVSRQTQSRALLVVQHHPKQRPASYAGMTQWLE